MRQESKTLLMTIAKDRVDQAARSLINGLSSQPQQGVLGSPPKSHFDQWRDGMTWRNGYRDNPNEMLAAVESYSKHLIHKIQDVRALQVAYDEMKATPVDGEEAKV